MISIHAPTRGATVGLTEFDVAMLISIHAPTRGATLLHTQHQLSEIFQSTLPQGERLYYTRNTSYPKYFNPRSHKGSDVSSLIGCGWGYISIHAPTRGATSIFADKSEVFNFNPRSHKGSDLVGYVDVKVGGYFNPRSHKGSD